MHMALKLAILQNVDTGDFVLDAIGQRWAGELGDGALLPRYLDLTSTYPKCSHRKLSRHWVSMTCALLLLRALADIRAKLLLLRVAKLRSLGVLP